MWTQITALPGNTASPTANREMPPKRSPLRPDAEKISFNPVVAESEDFRRPSRRKELQDTIAYICRVEFGAKVLFNGSPQPGARELKLHQCWEAN